MIIPTRNRRDVLLETLRRLARQQEPGCEVVVVDDGSEDDTARAVRENHPDVQLERQEPSGPAAARNRGLRAAHGAVCLFMGDDTWPCSGLLRRHLEFHRAHPEPSAALLGRMTWAPEAHPTDFMRWIEQSGIQFEYPANGGATELPGRFFYTANVSVKRAYILEHGGFDESFRHAASEDTELGMRLERAGMALAYDPAAAAEHFHPVDLPGTVRRMRVAGASTALLVERVGDYPVPRRPGSRHRVKSAALTALFAARVRPAGLRHATWEFLCHEAHREGFWGVDAPAADGLRIGQRLLDLAARDPATRPPAIGPKTGVLAATGS